jgi:glycosyltransferase involved in cell wall biosynthesis
VRIALVVAGGVDESGRERVIPSLLWLIERLARRHVVAVFAMRYLPEPKSYSLLGARVHDLGRPAGFFAQQRALHTGLETHGPFDVVHAFWAAPAGLHASIAARRLRVPSIATLDSGEFVAVPDAEYGQRLTWRRRAAVAITARCAFRVTVSTRFQAALARARRVAVDVIPRGVDTSLFTPPADRIGGPPWRLIHVASLNKVKDQPLLLRSLRILRDRLLPVHLDVVGEDTLNGAIQDQAKALGIAGDVTFHGFKPSDELVPLYQRAHLAVLTSRHEAAGVVTLEAAACGLATVGTDVGYVSDWDGTRSIAVRPAEPDALADAIADALADAPRRMRLGAAAREWAVTHNADWTAERFEELYRQAARL